MGLILDSSVVIAAERRGHTVRQILEQIKAAHGEIDIGLSVVTIAELMHGAYRAQDEARKRRRLAFIDRLCSDVPVHSMTVEIARRIGRIEGEQAAQGIVIAFEDLAIGVTALHLGFDIATLNVRHFQRIPGLQYDAEGNRVAKGSITTFSCDMTSNGFGTVGSDNLYILGPGGEQLTEMTWSGGQALFGYTKVMAAGQLIASYNPNGSQVALSFQLRDWLGTLRVVTDDAGNNPQGCYSLPYGNGETCLATTPYLFTGKERDAESGNDYFGARYYASSMGRFLSPDPENFGANIMNPQSWNMYSYAGNNPLINFDPDGRECVWDDGSYDSKDDPDSGSADKCAGLGGTWISDDIFENSQYYRGDWSGDANSTLSGLVGDIQSCSAAVGGGQAASLIVADSFASGFSNDQTAYALGTASYESGPGGMGSHMTEMGGPSYFSQYDGRMGNTSPGDGYTYRGRGYVQLTGKWSYNYWTNQIGQNLVQHPSLAATPDTAAEIMVEGFDRGSFRSGNSIQDYVNSSGSNFVGARAVVNGGGDQAQTIANAATGFSNSMSGCR